MCTKYIIINHIKVQNEKVQQNHHTVSELWRCKKQSVRKI